MLSPGLFQSPYSRRTSSRGFGELSPGASLDTSLYVTRTPLRGKVFLQDTAHDFVRASDNQEEVAQASHHHHGGDDHVQHAFATPPAIMSANGEESVDEGDATCSNQMDEALIETRIVDSQHDLSAVEDVPFEELQLMVPPIGILPTSLCANSDTCMLWNSMHALMDLLFWTFFVL